MYCEHCREERHGRKSRIYVCTSERTNSKGHISRRYESVDVLVCPVCHLVMHPIAVPDDKEVVVPSHT